MPKYLRLSLATIAILSAAGCLHTPSPTTLPTTEITEVPTPAPEPENAPVYTLPIDQVKFAKGYPVIPRNIQIAAREREEHWGELEDAAWHRAEPEVARWAAMGRPYIPLALNPVDLPQAKIPAFPGAEGGGAHTLGGRGGKIFVVTSLADDGPGTLRQACEAGGPRIAVFNVAGIIHLQRPLEIHAPYMTIAGQTAPGDGICIAGRTTEIDTHDVVIRYMRFRRGITELADRDDALGGDPIGNVIIDHCSCSWGLDETLSIYRQMYSTVPGDRSKRIKLPTMNITIQWTIISEGLNTYNHAFGGTWGGRNSTFSHNLLACNTGRNASIGMNFDFNFINNVIFNWHHRTLDGGDDLSLVNVINNYYKPGPDTEDNAIKYRIVLPQPRRERDPNAPRPFGKYYVAGNIVVGNDKVTADNWNGGVQIPPAGFNNLGTEDPNGDDAKKVAKEVRLNHPLPMAEVTIQPAQDAYESVLADGGANLPTRDPVDQRIINEVRTGQVTYKNGIITDISQVGGYPPYNGTPFTPYSENDGIPDWWKIKYNLKLHDPGVATQDCNGDGYTNIEKYIDGIDPTQKLDWTNPANNINTLSRAKLFGD